MTAVVQVRGVDGIQRALRPWLEPELTRELDAANKKGAQTMAKYLRAELRPVSKRMAKAVRVKRAKTGKPGWIVGGRRKTAFFWHMVIGGTRDHGPRRAPLLVFESQRHVVRTRRVRGVSAKPVVERVARRYEQEVLREIDSDMARSTGT